MLDHVHFFAMPSRDAKLRNHWHKMWKSVSARRITETLKLDPPIWQPDAFDHILRGSESYSIKWDCVVEDPVRAGLVSNASDWPWQGEIHVLRF